LHEDARLGQAELDAQLGAAWRSFVEWCDTWLTIERAQGQRDVEAAYRQILDGEIAPATGHVLSM
jgi:hypothetical protein